MVFFVKNLELADTLEGKPLKNSTAKTNVFLFLEKTKTRGRKSPSSIGSNVFALAYFGNILDLLAKLQKTKSYFFVCFGP